MIKIVALFAALALAIAPWAGTASAEGEGVLGRPLADFTVTDSQGNAFTLSKAVKGHEAVLINIWASWCGPCEREFPLLNDLYEKYGSRAAFIALSCDQDDTPESIEAYRISHGIPFPMGRVEDRAILSALGTSSIPATLIVDRFGNIAFVRVGAFLSEKDAERTLNAFLGDDYTETAVLAQIPPDDSTVVYPVTAARSLAVLNESARMVSFRADGETALPGVYLVPDETVRVRITVTAADDPAALVFGYLTDDAAQIFAVSDLYDTGSGSFGFEAAAPKESAESHVASCQLMDAELGYYDPAGIEILLIPGDEYIGEAAEIMEQYGYQNVIWEDVEPAAEDTAPHAYVLHVVDQYGAPVPNVCVDFCTDSSCVPAAGDERGTVTFEGERSVYRVQLVRLPEGYGADEGSGLYIGEAYGEWVLWVKKG